MRPAIGEWTLLTHTAWRWPDDVLVRLDRDLGDRRGRWPGLIVSWLPGNPGKWLWSGLAWLVPICSIAAIAHLLSGYFTR